MPKTDKKQIPDGKKEDAKEMPFLAHLEELRWCIVKSLIAVVAAMFISLPFSTQILNILTRPFYSIELPDTKMIFSKPTGMLVIRMEVALFAGLIAASPVVFYQFWHFISPGLLPRERKSVLPALTYTVLCFLIGIVFAYFVVIPIALEFSMKMATENIDGFIVINDYLSFMLRLILVGGLIFELPVISFFFSRIGLLTPGFMRKYRRYAIVLFFIISALITPPDIFSQLIMTIPMILLYEVSIWVSQIGQKRRQESENSDDAEKDN